MDACSVVNIAIQISRYLYRRYFWSIGIGIADTFRRKYRFGINDTFEAKKAIDTFLDTFCSMVRHDAIYCQVMVDSVRSKRLVSSVLSSFAAWFYTEHWLIGLPSSAAVERLFSLR